MKIKKNKHKFHEKETEKKEVKSKDSSNLQNVYGGKEEGHIAPETRPNNNATGIEDRFAQRKGEFGHKHHHHF